MISVVTFPSSVLADETKPVVIETAPIVLGAPQPPEVVVRRPVTPLRVLEVDTLPATDRTGELTPPIVVEPQHCGGIALESHAIQQDPELIELAVDVARRVVLAYHINASRHPIRTLEVDFRRQGDQVHTHTRLSWSSHRKGTKLYESDVFASFVYTPTVRRIYDLQYRDNCRVPLSQFDLATPIVTQINDDLKRRDPLGRPTLKLSSRSDVLMPRSRKWRWNPFSGDRDWHVGVADDRADRPARKP
ncbi:MAG: hypothetical protein AAGJ83_03910 [Planctomycetota bacterium]